MISYDDVFQIGVIGRPHGLAGEVSMHFTDDVFDRVDADYLFIEVEGILVPFFMETYRFKSDSTALLKFIDIDSVEQARRLTECRVFFPRSLSDSDDEDISLSELVGFSLKDSSTGQTVGLIEAVDETTINTLLEVTTPEGHDLLIPFDPDLVDNIDMEQQQLTLHIPEGLLNM